MKQHFSFTSLLALALVITSVHAVEAAESYAYEGSIFQYGDEEWSCRVKITWTNPKKGTITGTVKIGDHTVDLTGTNPNSNTIEFTTKDEDGKVDSYKLTKTKQKPVTWSGKRNGKDRISFSR